MKSWIIVIAIAATLMPLVEPAMTRQGLQQMQGMMRNMCKTKSGVQVDVLNTAKEGDFQEDQKFKCYLKCCLGMMKTMKQNKIDVEGATKQIEALLPKDLKEASLDQLNACKDVGGSDPCDLAYQFAVCSYKYNKDNFLIPL